MRSGQHADRGQVEHPSACRLPGMSQNGETDERMFSCLSPGTIGIRASLRRALEAANVHPT